MPKPTAPTYLDDERNRRLIEQAEASKRLTALINRLHGTTSEPKHASIVTVCGCGHHQQGGVRLRPHLVPGDEQIKCQIVHLQ